MRLSPYFHIYETIPGVPQEAERLIFSTLQAKSKISFTLFNKASFATNERRIVLGKAFHIVFWGIELKRKASVQRAY